MANIYHPKGSMCAVCTNKFKLCNKSMNFEVMPVMKKYKDDENNMYIVKCYMFNKHNQ